MRIPPFFRSPAFATGATFLACWALLIVFVLMALTATGVVS